jgi:hypothetical protein
MMLLLPGSLTTDHATLDALCEGLLPHSELARWLRGCDTEAADGSWSDWERAVSPLASEAPETHAACATLFHATLGLTDLTPLDPSQLQLSDEESRMLCDACDAHVREDGVRLEFVSAYEWRVITQRNISALTERADWIIGEPLRPNLPRGDDARMVERWMNELQMLLFNHPVNAARAERRLPPVNVVWLWGFDGLASAMSDAIDGRMARALRGGDVASWQQAWGDLQTKVIAADGVVLGDSTPRLKLTTRRIGFVESLRMKLTSQRLGEVLASLQSHL